APARRANRGACAGRHPADRQDHRHAQSSGFYHPPGRAEFSLRINGCGSPLRDGRWPDHRPVRQFRARRQYRETPRLSWRLNSETRMREHQPGNSDMKRLISLAALAVALGCGGAQAQYTDGTIKIGVMNDMSGTYSDISGAGALVAARMAVEDFGAAAKRMKVEIVGADHQNKPDVGSNVVRTWIDVDKIDVIV